MRMAKLLAGTCAAVLALSGATAWAADVTPDRLMNAGTDAEAGNWLMVHKTYNSNRFSTLNEINASNVSGLHVVTAAPIGGTEPAGFGVGAVEATPLANNGFLYVSDPWGTPYKFDVSDGKQRETGLDRATPASTRTRDRGILLAHRGLALSGNNVITALNNGHVIACDGETGDVVWDKQVGTEPGEGFTAAPLVIGDKVLVSQSYGDWATRGYIAALKADDRRRAVALLRGAGAGPAGLGDLAVRRDGQPRLLEDRRRRLPG